MDPSTDSTSSVVKISTPILSRTPAVEFQMIVAVSPALGFLPGVCWKELIVLFLCILRSVSTAATVRFDPLPVKSVG